MCVSIVWCGNNVPNEVKICSGPTISLLHVYMCIGHGKLLLGDGGYYEGAFVRGEMEGHGYRYMYMYIHVYTF